MAEYFVLDLHGEKHEFVESLVIRKVESLWNTNSDLIIITGNSDIMKYITKKILDEYKLIYCEGDIYNNGYIKTTV